MTDAGVSGDITAPVPDRRRTPACSCRAGASFLPWRGGGGQAPGPTVGIGRNWAELGGIGRNPHEKMLPMNSTHPKPLAAATRARLGTPRRHFLLATATAAAALTAPLSCGPIPCPAIPSFHDVAVEIRLPEEKGDETLHFTVTLGKETVACSGAWRCDGDLTCAPAPGMTTHCPRQGVATTRSLKWGTRTGAPATGGLGVTALAGSEPLKVVVLEDKLRFDVRHGEHCEADTTRAIVLRFDR